MREKTLKKKFRELDVMKAEIEARSNALMEKYIKEQEEDSCEE